MKTIEWGNPYNHEEHSRTSYNKNDLDQFETCAWCGERNRRNGLFSYDKHDEKFCSKECFTVYFNFIS